MKMLHLKNYRFIFLNSLFISLISLTNIIIAQSLPDPRTDTRGISNISAEELIRRRSEGEGVRQSLKESSNYNVFYRLTNQQKIINAVNIENGYLGENRNRLSVPIEYQSKLKEILRDKSMNLARIHPEKFCNYGKTVSIEDTERCAEVLPILGGGSYYSFRIRTNLNETIRNRESTVLTGEWADIHYVDEKIVAGGETIQGIISEIGDVDLREIESESNSVSFLKDYKPEKKFKEIQKQKNILKKGINFGSYTYSDSAPVKINSTYLLRSIAYDFHPIRGSFDPLLTNPFIKKVGGIWRENDIRKDIIVIFKIVGREKDNSLILLWKNIKTKDSPMLILEKPEK